MISVNEKINRHFFCRYVFTILFFDSLADSGFDVTQEENVFTSPECVLCEEVIHEVEKKVQNDKSRVSGSFQSFRYDFHVIVEF